MYKLIVYQILYKHIKQKNRTIQKKYFLKIKEVPNIKKEDLSVKSIELARNYKDTCYIISSLKMEEEDYYINNLNAKSKKDFFSE